MNIADENYVGILFLCVAIDIMRTEIGSCHIHTHLQTSNCASCLCWAHANERESMNIAITTDKALSRILANSMCACDQLILWQLKYTWK